MLNINKRVLSVIATVAIAGGIGIVGATTLANTPKTSATVVNSEISSTEESTISIVSSDVSSQMQSSSEVVSKVDTSSTTAASTSSVVSKATQSIAQPTASSAVSTSSVDTKYIPKYQVIDPDNGQYISPNNSKYETIKAKLGGDAGTVPPEQSTICKPIIEKFSRQNISKAN
ncbi:MAG TPA: hypothetical protein VHO94_04015 [Oscillospiraceae bacterium]|nr:hypothetical protein [Oscillospiraceae bacterium]